MKWVLRVFLSALALVLIAALVCILLEEAWVAKYCMAATPRAKPSCRAVLRAYLWGEFVTGRYWIDEDFSPQAKALRSESLKDRVAFYRCVLLACDLDTSNALIFFETVGQDAQALRDDLAQFSEQPEYRRLAAKQRENIRAWTQELDIIIRQPKPK